MSNTRKPKTLGDVLAVTKPAERVVRLCVAGDLFAEHQRLEDELQRAQDSTARSAKINDANLVVAKAKQIDALEAKMEKHTFDFRFRAMRKHEWADLTAAHPPKKDNAFDQRYGCDTETFFPLSVQRCCIEPEGMDDDGTFVEFWDTLNFGQRFHLWLNGAFAVNSEGSVVPKSVEASAAIRSYEQSSDT